MPASTHPSNLQRRIHAGGGRVLEQRKSTGVRIHTTPQVGADGKPAEAPHRRAHGDDYPLELRSSLTNRHMETIYDATGRVFITHEGLTTLGGQPYRRGAPGLRYRANIRTIHPTRAVRRSNSLC